MTKWTVTATNAERRQVVAALSPSEREGASESAWGWGPGRGKKELGPTTE